MMRVLVAGATGAIGKQPAPRLAAGGEVGAVPLTKLGGAGNAKARRELGWQPAHPSWRRGLAG